MICTSVIPCLSSSLAKITKLCPCLSYFPGCFVHFECLAFFSKMGDKPCIKAVRQDDFSQFFKGKTIKEQIFLQKHSYFD